MKNVLRFVLLLTAFAAFLQSGWVSYSVEKQCPTKVEQEEVGIEQFLSAHGISHENYSIWLKEHSVWRRKYTDELKDFSYIPPDYDIERK